MTTGFQDEKFIESFKYAVGGDFDWIIEWVTENFSPDQVFDESKLQEWALENGFIEESQHESVLEEKDRLESEVDNLESDLDDCRDELDTCTEDQGC